MARKVDLPTFFAIWADDRKWSVPDVHWRALHWLENRGDLAVMRCFRGFAKSTILAIYNAHCIYKNPKHRILHQSESDPTAWKTSRDTKNVLNRHPLTRGMYRDGGVEQWWAIGNDDERNGSMYSRGILSNVTSARCDEAQNDDVEVPRNIRTPEAREQLEYRLNEQTFILVPGGKQLYVGTPHTHDSIYDKVQGLGADCLTIPLFGNAYRIEAATQQKCVLPFRAEYVFSGIGRGSRLLVENADYTISGTTVHFAVPPGGLVDFYADCAWPERFTRDDLQKRRRKTKTVNYWDSQYQLHSKPVHEVRLDPANIQAYDCEPVFKTANKVLTMWLGEVQVVGHTMRWDPSSGKVNSDMSAVCLDLQDATGRHYWHRMQALVGEVAETDDKGKLTGGQVWQLCDLIEKFKVRRVTVETNGIGGFAPAFLKQAIKQRRLVCGVAVIDSRANKNRRMLEALEPLLQSRMLWAHVSVLQGPLWDMMKDWNPAVPDQPDDLMDAGAGAVTDQPVRIGASVRDVEPIQADDWRPAVGVFEAQLEG